ncbi:MAG: FtsW/RodA/SpoVE family cell cycle protein [Anaerolineales bacterium]|nr:FtsW/RodA/SpoVE family cell cycle protein [Anaerolineales bacterium]
MHSLWNASGPDLGDSAHRREAALLLLTFIFLCLVGLGLTLANAARVQDWAAFPGRFWHLVLLPVWAVGAWLLHREINRIAPGRDPYLLPIALLLTGWGVMMIWRLEPAFGIRQTLWFSLSCLLILGLFRLDPKLRWLRDYRYLWMALALTLLGLTLIFGTNPLGGEPRLWLGCCGVYFQPSEPLRFFLVAFLASYLAERLRLDNASSGKLHWKDFLPLVLVWGVSILLLVVQRDLGTGMIFLALLALLLYLAIDSWQVLLVSGVLAVGGGVLSYFLFDIVQIRVQAWLNPWLEPSGASYQIVQSVISIASGSVVGRGPGLGSPGFVPASHTDFIFSAIVEEFGFAGGIGLLTLFAILISRGLRAASKQRDVFSRFLAAGLTMALGIQAIFIIGGVMRALPLVGITLPFVSYGGSSLLTSFAVLAILLLLSQTGGVAEQPRIRALDSIQLGFSLAWFSLAFVLAWWTIYRAPTLTARTDNPRRSLDSRFVERGMIVDRNGIVLARSVGEPGSYQRDYPYAEAAPVTGFDSVIFGQSGIERSMDGVLRGLERGSLIENTLHRLVVGHPPEGENVQLTIDVDLQALAMDALAGRAGAAVLLEAHSGELYVIASQPSYDPNELEQLWTELIDDETAPLFNRATQGLYQPGLTMAPFVFAQGKAQGELPLDLPVSELTRAVDVNGETLTCSLAPVDSLDNTLEDALRYGCPKPIQQAALALGWEPMLTMAASFGFTQPVDIFLNTASPTLVAAEQTAGSLAQFAVGQGDLRVSPAQMARAFGGLFAGDERAPLQLVRAVDEDDQGWVLQEREGYRVPALASGVTAPLEEVYAAGETQLYDLRAQALSGSEGQLLGWYLGALDREDALWVVVVVLEGDQPYVAEGIGRKILGAVPTDLSP